jgi:hypothetical protein
MTNTKNTKQNKINNIDYMWWKLPLVPNTTNMIKGKWKDNQTQNITGNHAVLTGEINNITGLDLDFGYKLSDEELNSNPITKEFIDKFGKKPNWDTYTVRTRSGGLHYYFQYENDIKQTQDDDCKIDIRGKGGILYGAGTKVTKGEKQGEYICINNKEPIKMPDDLKEFLLENLYNKSTKSKTKKNTKTKTKKMKNYNENYYKYSFSDDLLRKIFDGLSKKYWESVVEQDGEPCFLVWTTACKSLDCYDLWDEYNQKYDGYDFDKNDSMWESVDPSYNCVTNLLKNTSFPNAFKLIDYHKYQPILEDKIEPDVTFDSSNNKGIEKGKIGKNYFQENINYIMKSDTGTGKTTSFQKYIERTNQKFISLTSRVSLADDQYKRFSAEIDNVHYYKNVNYNSKLFQKKENGKYNMNGSIVCELESLLSKIEYIDEIENISHVIVYLDEYNSLIEALHTSSTFDNNLTFIYEDFILLLKKCKQVICTDADISDTSILWFKENIGRDFEFHKNEYKHNKNVIAHEILSYDTFIDKLHKTKKWLIPCDSRINAMKLHRIFPDAILIEKDTLNIPDLDSHDRIIYSPKILYGVDSTMKREVFCFFQERTINPAQMVQMMCRCRNITKLHYFFHRKKFQGKDVDYEDVWDEIQSDHQMSLKYFKNRHFRHLEKAYLKTLHRIIYNKKCYDSNPYAHFKMLIKERGIQDVNLYMSTNSGSFHSDVKAMKEAIKDEQLYDFDIEDEKYKKINSVLKIPKDECNKYKLYFIEDGLRYNHYNISTMFFKKNIDQKFDDFDFFDSQNFTVNKLKQNKTKLKFLQDLKIECGCLDPFDIVPKQLPKKDIIEDYKKIFRIRSKTVNFDSIYACQKNIVTMYKNLFGKKIIDTDDKDKRKGSKKCYSLNEKMISKEKELFLFRDKISEEVKFVNVDYFKPKDFICDLDK